MVIYSIKLFRADRLAEGEPFMLEREIVGVDLDAVRTEANRIIALWLRHGYTEDDYLAVVGSGASYRYEPADFRESIPVGFVTRSEPGAGVDYVYPDDSRLRDQW
jgi:hypothetical protein